MFNSEEIAEYGIKPRLVANGADCSKVFLFDKIELSNGTSEMFNIQTYLDCLNSHLDDMPDCRLMVFDPITAYLGKCDANDNAQVRSVLLGLQDLAARRKITIIGISHLSKKVDIGVIHRVLGSTGFVAAARSVWAVAIEKDDTADTGEAPGRLFLPVKSNYSIEPTGLKFRIIDGVVCFDPTATRIDVDTAFEHKSCRVAVSVEKAEAWLRDRLQIGTTPAKELFEDAKAEGISSNALRAAQQNLGVRTWKSGLHNGWVWTLSGGDSDDDT